MAEQDTTTSATSPDPVSPDDLAEDENRPPDESYLLGVPGVEDEVLAELARAEAGLNDPEEEADESDGAVV